MEMVTAGLQRYFLKLQEIEIHESDFLALYKIKLYTSLTNNSTSEVKKKTQVE